MTDQQDERCAYGSTENGGGCGFKADAPIHKPKPQCHCCWEKSDRSLQHHAFVSPSPKQSSEPACGCHLLCRTGCTDACDHRAEQSLCENCGPVAPSHLCPVPKTRKPNPPPDQPEKVRTHAARKHLKTIERRIEFLTARIDSNSPHSEHNARERSALRWALSAVTGNDDQPAPGTESVVAAAIHDGATVNVLPKPARHHDLIHAMAGRGDTKPIRGAQGFITSEGRFVDRAEAHRIAFGTDGEVFSEDLW